MIPGGDGKSESNRVDPEEITRQLELAMAQERAAWAAALERSRKIRTISFAFLAIVVMGALLGFLLLVLPRLQERQNPGSRAQPTATP